MKTGLLIFDDDAQRTLAQKVDRAVDYFRAKYGHAANLVYANRQTIGAGMQGQNRNAVVLMPSENIQPFNFWLGVGGE